MQILSTSVIDHIDGTVSAQGDIVFFKLPRGWTPVTNDEIKPVDGLLIIQEGELTGHHHAIRIPGFPQVAMFRDDALARDLAAASPVKLGSARLYRDGALAARMTREKIGGQIILERSDLCVGFLVVEGGDHIVTHDEHAGICLGAGTYYCGRQIESAGAEERKVAD